jgi:hypothetical protein
MAYETLHENDDSKDKNSIVAVGVYYFEEQDGEVSKIW